MGSWVGSGGKRQLEREGERRRGEREGEREWEGGEREIDRKP